MNQVRFLRGTQADLEKLIEKQKEESNSKNEMKTLEESDSENGLKIETDFQTKK